MLRQFRVCTAWHFAAQECIQEFSLARTGARMD